MDTSSLLEVIAEKTSNSEQILQTNSVKMSISELLRTMSSKERITRESGIMIKQDDNVNSELVSDVVENKYCNLLDKPSAIYWQDKQYAYVQFVNRLEKDLFLGWIQRSRDHVNIRNNILPPNDSGEHLVRKPVRIMINNVRRPIKTELVERAVKNVLGDNCLLENFRAGKADNMTGSRAIMFATDAEGFKKLFGDCEGQVPYYNAATKSKTRLFLKINCKPWACKDCFAFGIHDCQGKLCANCGHKDHLTKDCKVKTKFCKNCKRKGHRAKDSHCPIYQNEVAKELRKFCIPLEFFDDKDKRFNLLKHIQIS